MMAGAHVIPYQHAIAPAALQHESQRPSILTPLSHSKCNIRP